MAIKFTELVKKGEGGGNWENIAKALLNQGTDKNYYPLSAKWPFEITTDMFDQEIRTWEFNICENPNITKIVVPENIEFLNGTIYKCQNLESVEFYGKVGITSGQLTYCPKLKIVNAPNAVEVNYESLSECEQLEKVRIPNIDTLRSSPFQNCPNLKLIDFRGRHEGNILPDTDSTSLQYIPSTCKIVVPDSWYNTFISTSPWSGIASQIVKESEYVE